VFLKVIDLISVLFPCLLIQDFFNTYIKILNGLCGRVFNLPSLDVEICGVTAEEVDLYSCWIWYSKHVGNNGLEQRNHNFFFKKWHFNFLLVQNLELYTILKSKRAYGSSIRSHRQICWMYGPNFWFYTRKSFQYETFEVFQRENSIEKDKQF
jgi:hypothetical protein